MPTEIKIISHSNVFYWWPAWVVGFAVALISFVQGREIAIEPGIVERVHPSNNPGIFFIAVVVMLVQVISGRRVMSFRSRRGAISEDV